MSDIIALCGLNCSQCSSFLATRDDDDQARARTSRWMAETYDIHIPPQKINCDGCQARDGRRLSYCEECRVRACAVEKGISTCAECEAQPCEDLAAFHRFSPQAKEAFDTLI